MGAFAVALGGIADMFVAGEVDTSEVDEKEEAVAERVELVELAARLARPLMPAL